MACSAVMRCFGPGRRPGSCPKLNSSVIQLDHQRSSSKDWQSLFQSHAERDYFLSFSTSCAEFQSFACPSISSWQLWIVAHHPSSVSNWSQLPGSSFTEFDSWLRRYSRAGTSASTSSALEWLCLSCRLLEVKREPHWAQCESAPYFRCTLRGFPQTRQRWSF